MIREFRTEDAEAVSAILHEEQIPQAVTPAGILHWRDSQPAHAHARLWVAEEEGRVVGWSEARLRWTTSAAGVGDLWGFVAPSERGRGLGTALYEHAAGHLQDVEARAIETWTYTPAGEKLLVGRGFRAQAEERISVLHLAEVDTTILATLEREKAAEGFRVVPLRDVANRVEEIHRVYAAAAVDIPDYFPEDNVRLDEWRRETLEHPQLSRDGSFMILSGEQPVALAFLEVDEPARIAANELTGTLPEFRRRGLARLAKLSSIRWAAEQAFDTMVTGNAETNKAMLGLNESLGYRRIRTEIHFVRE